MRNNVHVGQDVSNTMTTDWSQDSRGTTSKRPSKVLFTQLVQKQPSGNLLLIVLRDFIKRVITVQTTHNVICVRSVEGHGRNKKLLFPDGRESKKRSAIVPTSRNDLLKASGKRGRASSNSIASRQADGMNTHHIRTETTNGAGFLSDASRNSAVAEYQPHVVPGFRVR